MNPSLMKLKLLEALRNNDVSRLQSLLEQLGSQPSAFELLDLKSCVLLFAVQVGPLSMVKYIVDNSLVEDINVQDKDGNTALHLAASSNRLDVIQYLMGSPGINDCLYNKDNKQPIQLTTNIETAQLMDYLRTKHIEKIASQLRSGFESRNFDVLDGLLSNPRDRELLDINGLDPVTNDTVLIEFVKKRDYAMVKFILAHGGDPFKRNLSGKLPGECTADPEMKKLIESSFNEQNIMDTTSHPQEGSPSFKGFLKKWTNFAGGYKLRWFVLDSQAVLSYYKSPNDMNNTCRGLIHLAHAMLKVNSSENTKFEIIIQNPSDGTPVRWHLMANHATEAQKWIWVLQNAIRFAKDVEKQQRKSITMAHNLSEDLPASPRVYSKSDTAASVQNPATIHEAEVLSAEAIEKEHGAERKPVGAILSEANEAASDFKNLMKQTDSETDLPLKTKSSMDGASERDSGAAGSEHSHNDVHSTNSSISHNSLRNHLGLPQDRTSVSSASKAAAIADENHGRTRSPSQSSLGSQNSNVSERSHKHSRAKNLYKKPLKKLGRIGRKTRNSFAVPAPHSTTLAPVGSSASLVSDDSSIVSSHDYLGRPSLEDTSQFGSTDDFGQGQGAIADCNNHDNTDLNVVRNQMSIQLHTFKDFLVSAEKDETIEKADLVDTSVTILNTLDMLINQEGECVNQKYNELVRKLEKQQKISLIWENSIKQLELEIHQREHKIVELEDKLKAVKKSLRNSVSNLHSSVSAIPEHVRTHLPQEKPQSSSATSAAALARQALTANMQKNSSLPSILVTEPSVDSVEQREEEKRAIEKREQLQKSSQTAGVQEAPRPAAPEFAPPAVPFNDPTLAEFLEESDDSDDEFFDAEESDEVKDMSILERRETMRALKRKQSAAGTSEVRSSVEEQPAPASSANPSGSMRASNDVSADGAKTAARNEHKPSAHDHPALGSAAGDAEVAVSNSGSNNQQPAQSQRKAAVPVEKPLPNIGGTPRKSNGTSSAEASGAAAASNTESSMSASAGSKKAEPNFKPEKDESGHFVVNKHELVSDKQISRFNKILEEETFEGYEDPLRLSLAPEDNRPKISLWGVLKSLVGKDMTKMTLPVSFNEPTSLLQRNAEVIEYSELLDKAAAIDNSTLRLVYVATFAASEYASTVGRIAKPFNPLLGETFEYARPDKGYRCFVEQVSHHPPISALVAEAPSWSYYGESNVKTKFLGRSFDIKHLGTWFCEIFPDHGVECKNGDKVDKEVYSWRKVNNSVIGIIVGNPTIDNYGSMEIRNHMTGDYMSFEFKPRGWRASSAYEVKGEVFNAQGKLMYYVGGHWNSKIFCKPAHDKNAERFLVWEAAERHEMMFHLTNFAATLNAPQPHLLPKVACTDTRLRPDQRAMEDGNYDLAAEEKNRVEEKQRAARSQREAKGETYHPSFFTKASHPVTGEKYWKFGGSYWKDRKDGKLKKYKDIF